MRYKLAFTLGEQPCSEVGEVEQFPPAEKWGALQPGAASEGLHLLYILETRAKQNYNQSLEVQQLCRHMVVSTPTSGRVIRTDHCSVFDLRYVLTVDLIQMSPQCQCSYSGEKISTLGNGSGKRFHTKAKFTLGFRLTCYVTIRYTVLTLHTVGHLHPFFVTNFWSILRILVLLTNNW